MFEHVVSSQYSVHFSFLVELLTSKHVLMRFLFLYFHNFEKKEKKKEKWWKIFHSIIPDKIEPYNISLKENTKENDLLLNTLPSVIQSLHSLLSNVLSFRHFQTYLLLWIILEEIKLSIMVINRFHLSKIP